MKEKLKALFDRANEIFKAKKWVRVTTYTVVSILILLIVVMLTLGQIIKAGAAALGPVIAGVPVKIESISIGFLGNFKVDLKNLTVGNPEGYASSHMLKLQNFYLEVNTASLLSKKIVVKKIHIKGVDVNFETNLLTSNLAEVDKNVKKIAGESSSSSSASSSKPQPLQVDDVLMEDVKVAIAVKGSKSRLPVPIAPIHLQNLGTGPDGITPAGLVQELLENLLSGIGGLLKSGAASLGDAADSAAKGIGSAADSAVKGIGDLFSSKKAKKAPAPKK